MDIHQIPDPNLTFPNDYGTSCFIKNVVKAPNIQIGLHLLRRSRFARGIREKQRAV